MLTVNCVVISSDAAVSRSDVRTNRVLRGKLSVLQQRVLHVQNTSVRCDKEVARGDVIAAIHHVEQQGILPQRQRSERGQQFNSLPFFDNFVV